MADVKPGWKTSEFWLASAATLVGLVMASGLIEAGGTWDRIVGLIAAALASMGYSASRASVKKGE
jgi:hypothetical protein